MGLLSLRTERPQRPDEPESISGFVYEMRLRGETRTISFRLAGKALAELEQQARAFGISPGELSGLGTK